MSHRTRYWICQILGWGGYSAIGIAETAQQVGWRFPVFAGYGLFMLYSVALTELLRREIRRRDWLSLSAGRMMSRLALGALVVAAIQTVLVAAVDMALNGHASQFRLHPEYIFALGFSVFGADAMWLLFYVVLTSNRRHQEKEVRLNLSLREAELRALQAQINPHFLFNCLNSIRALVLENPPLAQEMITRFAAILRYNLQRDLTRTAPLREELAVMEDYLALESVRFEGRLRVTIAVEPGAAEWPVPPMMLQTLVENALKHGISKLPAGGEVVIRAVVESGDLVTEVENSGALDPNSVGGTKLGLANARERLRILYGGRASLELANGDGRVRATLRVPRSA
jgi:hypothetical protein